MMEIVNPIQPPSRLFFQESNIPREMKSCKQWISWTWTWNGKKWGKVPIRIGGGKASSTREDDWSSYERALRYHKGFEVGGLAFRGMGFIFTKEDDFVGIDLDNCRNPQTGEITAEATEIILRFGSYAEISPSLTGVKIIVRGKKPDWAGHANHEKGVEVYEHARFFTMTSCLLPGMPAAVCECQETLDWLCEKYLKREKKKEWKPPAKQYKPKQLDAHDQRQDVLSALSCINNSPGKDFDDWLAVGMALHSYDTSLLGEWESWSAQSTKHVPGECARRWDSFSAENGIKLGTLFHFAMQDGWVSPIRRDVTPRGDDGPFRMDARHLSPLEEFAGEAIFTPAFVPHEHVGPGPHGPACPCQACEDEAREKEIKYREEVGYSCRNNQLLTNGDNTFFCRVDCRCWKCKNCRQKILIPKWQEHLGKIISEYDSVHIATVPHDSWRKTSREIRQAKGDYFRIATAEDEVLFVSTVPFCGSSQVGNIAAESALNVYMGTLRGLPSRRKVKSRAERPIVTSKGWSLDEEKEDSGYKKIQMRPASDSVIRKAAAEFRIKVETINLDHRGDIAFAKMHLPPEYYGDHLAFLHAFAARVEEIAYPPSRKSMQEEADIDLRDIEDGWGNLDAYPQDPIWASPPAG